MYYTNQGFSTIYLLKVPLVGLEASLGKCQFLVFTPFLTTEK